MNDETKKKINERYERELNKGERFWPDSIFKDVIVSLGIFVLLILMATFIGVASEPKADPSDTAYIPRPEWYFLFIFKFLALYGQIPVLGKIEWIATIAIPGIAVGVLTLLPFIDKSPYRYYGKRVLPIAIMTIMVVGSVLLSLMSEVPTVTADGSRLLGILQAIAGIVIPSVAMILLFLMSFVFKKTSTGTMVWTTVVSSVLMIAFSVAVLALYPKPIVEETEVAITLADQIFAGQDLYSLYCVECHGDDGKLEKITGVEGLEDKEITPINSRDVLYTITDSAMYEVIAYGRPNSGMTPFGKAYGGELSKSQIDYMVIYMRYMWDDRFEPPTEVLKPLFPKLADGEVPSYDVHIQPIVKRYCISCHRAGKDNKNYLMTTYEEILTTGDSKDNNVIAGDENSYLLQVIQGQSIPDPENPTTELIRSMPPTSDLKPNIVDVFVRWVMNGMPRTAEDAAALFVAPTPASAPVVTPTP
ncbi:MAG: c-type cytochrome [Anaerolineales bacterium]|nr:c-type cytochrome [Anaerolineales bacterium]